MASIVLKTKLQAPILRPGLVKRSALLSQLKAGVDGNARLTLVSAPAGYGKTTLIGEWLTTLPTEWPRMWVSLDEGDNSAADFWTYVLSALEPVNPVEINRLITAVKTTDNVVYKHILADLINILTALTQPILLVLDDLHRVQEVKIFEQLAYFLDYCPKICHLVLITRADPPLPLPKFRARGQMTEIRAGDIVFSAEEARQFLQETMETELKETVSDALYTLTEGWPAGLQMAGLSVKKHKNDTFVHNKQFNRQQIILDYLFQEVLLDQPPEVRHFLLATAVVERFSPSLAGQLVRELSPDITDKQVNQILRRLQEQNLFLIPLDGENTWFRYHHLFADLLRYTVKQEIPQQEEILNRSAADWYWQQWLLSDKNPHTRQYAWLELAMQYCLSVNDWEQAAEWIKQVWQQTCHESRIDQVLSWLNTLPGELIQKDVELLGAFAWVMWLKGRLQDAAPYVFQALAVLGIDPKNPDYRQVPDVYHHILILLSFFILLNGDQKLALEIAKFAFEQSTPQEPLGHGVSAYFLANIYRVVREYGKSAARFRYAYPYLMAGGNYVGAAAAVYHAAQIELHQGKLSAAEDFCKQAIQRAKDQQVDQLADYGAVWTALAEIHLMRLELDQTQAALDIALEHLRYSQLNEMTRSVYRLSARLADLLEDKENLSRFLSKSLETARKLESPFSRLQAEADQAKFLLKQGQETEAYAWFSSGIYESVLKSPLENDYLAAAADSICAVLTHQKQWEKILVFTETVDPVYQSQQLELDRMITMIWHSIACDHLGQKDLAETALVNSLKIAAPERIITPYLSADEITQKRLFNIQLENPTEVLFVKTVLTQLLNPVRKKHGEGTLVEPLTERELEILNLVKNGYANQEIANELYITLYTVKKHISNILGKLGVRSRTQAITKARSLNLIDKE